MNKLYSIIILMLLCGNTVWAQMGGNRPPNLSDNDKLNMINRALDKAGNDKRPPLPGGGVPVQKSKKKHVKAKYKVIKDAKEMYIYGLAYNPTDSVIYVTDEMSLDSAQIYKKTKFLVNRDVYANELRSYMDELGEKNRTCAVTFATSIKKLDKKFKKEMAYLKKHGYLIKHKDQSEFRFIVARNEE